MTNNLAPIVPGDSPDPDDNVEKQMKAAWALCGMTVSFGVLTYCLDRTGFTLLPIKPGLLDYVRAGAFLIACTNILCWIWFPLEDLRVLRMWVRTKKAFFSAHTAEFLGMVLATVLLVSLIVSSTINAFVFGIVGTGVYVWDLLGFAIIRRQVSKVVAEAKNLYSGEVSTDKKNLLLKAIEVIENHWACSSTHGALRNAQQIRRLSLVAGFLIVALLGYASRRTSNADWELYAYILGSVTIVAAEVSHAIWRTARDISLHQILEELRALNGSTT